MLRLFLAGQLLLLALAVANDDFQSFANSSDSALHRSKRALFVPNTNCPDPLYLTQAQVSQWPGIAVDTSQTTILDEKSGLNLFKCSEDTFFVYTHLPTVMTRANWWLACGPTLSTGWRVRDAGSKNSAYGVIPVGCVKPKFPLAVFDGSEFVLASYPTYQIVPNQPSLIGINQKFQFICPAGSTPGYAATATTIALDATLKVTCDIDGWYAMTSTKPLNPIPSTVKVGCFKQIPALPPTVPTQCQTGITYFAANEKLTKDVSIYAATADKAVFVNGQWALVCPTDSIIGFADTAGAFLVDASIRVTCEATGWWIKTGWNAVGHGLLPGKIGCFLKQAAQTQCATTTLQLFDGSEAILRSHAAKYQLVPTVPAIVAGKLEFICPSGTTTAYAQITGDIRLLVEPIAITCESAGWWVKAPLRVDALLPAVKVGCLKELFSSVPPAPASVVPRQPCGCWYERSTCRTCDSSKLFVLDGHGALSARCTLGCGKGYVFEGGENMLSCDRGWWVGSSKTATGVTVPQSGPFGYIITSCVPEPSSPTCSTSLPTFECLGCDKSKIISIPSTKSTKGCVFSCDVNYRILILDASQKVTRAQEIVEENGSFTVYPLGFVNTTISIASAGAKFSCELSTTSTAAIVVNPGCKDLHVFDGSEPIIAANAAVYEFIPTIPSLVGGKHEFVCPAGFLIGHALGDTKLSVEPLKIACDASGEWRIKFPYRGDGFVYGVKVGCFKEIIRTSIPAAPVPTTPKDPCGCWYERAACHACDSQKLFVLDGYGATSGKCTLGCAKGYVFEGGEYNMLSCEGGYWFGSSRATANAIIALFGPFGYVTASCIPATTPATCALPFSTFSCVGCDSSKIFPVSSTKSKTGCVLACDKDYRLMVQEASGKITRAQEAVTETTTVTVYPLGTVKNPIQIDSTGVKFSCEKVATDTPTTMTTVSPVVTTPLPLLETCGCPYKADVSNPAYDISKLYIQDTQTDKCTVQCDVGYRLTGARSSASCFNRVWTGVNAEANTRATFDGTFSCEKAAAPACTRVYNIGACPAGKVCNPSALRTIKGAKSDCILSCARGYRLLSIEFHSLNYNYQEFYYDVGSGNWHFVSIGKSGVLWGVYANNVTPSITCERYISPAEAARIPPDTEKRTCGCPYDFSGCPTCDWKQMFRLEGFLESSGTCTLGCGAGYMFQGGQVNLITCKAGQGWIGSSSASMVAPITMATDRLVTSCVPVPATPKCAVPYATFTCEKGYCYPEELVALNPTKSPAGCVLSCSKGHRLLVHDASRKVTRIQEAVAGTGLLYWLVYDLGETQKTYSISSTVKFSCEYATLSTYTIVPL